MSSSPTWMMALALLAGPVMVQAQAPQPVLQRGYDANVSGATLTETTLNTSNVGPNTFGLVFNLVVDDRIYAQPLYVPNVAVPNQGTHNIVYVATMSDTVYAFDADKGGKPLWSVNLAALLDTTAVSWTEFSIPPLKNPGNLGILSTPVIDPSTNVMYVVACDLEGGTMAYRLHALDITTGEEPYGPGVLVAGNYGGITFNARYLDQRVSLVLADNQVVFGFASLGAEYPKQYSGWVFAYNKTTLQQSGAFVTVTTGNTGGGVWQSGRPPAVDSSGYVYVFTGNGYVGNGFNGGYDGVYDFSESVLKLEPSQSLALVDWFTPSNWSYLDSKDLDLGSAGPLLIPGTNLLAGSGKTGILYVLNTANLGKYTANDSGALQEVSISAGEVDAGPVMWNRPVANGGPVLYNWGASDVARAYPFSGSTFAANPSSMSTNSASWPGGVLALSANAGQSGSGVLWATTQAASTPTMILHAFDAANLAHELWNNTMVPTRDDFGDFSRFAPPLIANGKVYVPTLSSRVAVYGLGVAPPTFTVSPTSLAFGNVDTGAASAAQPVLVTNTSGAALPIASITLTGASANQFSQTNTCGTSIPIGSSCTISVVFTPAAAGGQTATLNIKGGSSVVKTTALTGTGVVAYTVLPASLAFGNVQTGSASAAQGVTVTNSGSAALPITGIALTGAYANQYSQTNNCGTSVAAGSSCSISVVFAPTSAGSLPATLSVNGQTVALSGQGVVAYTVSPASLAFGNVPTGTASAAQAVTVTNSGSAALPIASVTIAGVNAGQYSQTNNCGTSVPAKSTCTISVVFAPTSSGSKPITLRVNAGPGTISSVSLSGQGIVPFTVLPASLAFGNEQMGTASPAQSVTVTNGGSAALPITSITLVGVNSAQYSQTNTCGASVSVGSTCTISVVFAPTKTGSLPATLSVNAGPGTILRTTLSGTGVAAK